MNSDEQTFIEANKQKSVAALALLLSKKPALNKEFILSQINGIQKAKTKLPEFFNTPNIIYPSKLSMEQCSSEKTGTYKSELVKGEKMIDLTGGFGIDSYYFSKKFDQVTYIEQNKALVETTKHNFSLLKADNIKLINVTAEEFINTTEGIVDLIYIDPSRRSENERIFMLKECAPNIIDLAPKLFSITNKILVKTAPLLDIKQTLRDLKHVTKVWVVSVKNDCKEVLYLLEKDAKVEPEIYTVNFLESNQEFHFNFQEESDTNSSYSEPLNYLYEPNASVLKAGAFKSIGENYKANKLASSTHLYTSTELIEDFPGRIFKIAKVLPYQPKDFKKLGLAKANVSTRNFKDNPEQVKKKLKLKDGGEHYLFATTDLNGKPILIICVK